MSDFPKYVSVILDLSLSKPLDYGVPKDLAYSIKKGMRVQVTVKGHQRFGTVFAVKETPSFPKVLPIKKILSESETVTEELFELAFWMSKYYAAPLSQVLKVMLPSSVRKELKPKQQLFVMRGKTREELQEICKQIRGKSPQQALVLDCMFQVKKGILLTELLEKSGGKRSSIDTLVKKGLLIIDEVQIDRSLLSNEEYFMSKPKTLSAEQKEAFDQISENILHNRFETHLLLGVTGSGKTEVYLQAIAQALKMGKGAIVLVPEISLTAQTIERFKSRFVEKIAVLHHRLSHGERFDEWNNILSGKAKIVIGARSAIFSPVQNLGVIIVDEEHENSYKQNEEAPCYHARDVAVMRGKMADAVVILGSATPSLESYYNAQNGKYILNTLHKRAESSVKPNVVIVDMKKEFERAKGYTNFSDILLTGIKKRHQAGEQTILFLNRRGYHTTFFCSACKEAIKCCHCDMALTYHLRTNALSCHLCGFTLAPPPKNCPKCKNPDPMKYRGVGTELLEKSLHAILPDIRVIRLDKDTTKHKGSHQRLLRDFGTGKADVLIGTQMIAKGLHFPEVTLVGVINCDTGLHIPDFRSSETVFQLITQVAGRAGRGSLLGEVILQTCMPENSTICHASNQDYKKFYQEEIETRKIFCFPPFTKMVKLSFTGEDEKKTLHFSETFRKEVANCLYKDYEATPAIAAGHAKVKDKYKFQFFIRGPNISAITCAVQAIQKSLFLPNGIKMLIDINPTSTYF